MKTTLCKYEPMEDRGWRLPETGKYNLTGLLLHFFWNKNDSGFLVLKAMTRSGHAESPVQMSVFSLQIENYTERHFSSSPICLLSRTSPFWGGFVKARTAGFGRVLFASNSYCFGFNISTALNPSKVSTNQPVCRGLKNKKRFLLSVHTIQHSALQRAGTQ